ncbi:Type II/IV secretion system ATP hydrolase TadA/VirB11/CpaF, TadA subfamily [Candidatus Hydrogenisulfobacillus filiaventi]|uniref:Type II/IV secretion system ATP hydrolase TadA/VirB11/CpaF, TadA subfamily n=1 Tax=Candidatus Hydrogenisulfobacillus filiaventi TaxID=2707344 RepID=A0A6F8ZEK9_9FIRM|nr:Type II/IV secretion system ATP hydrolase TadA/VirB11/CpaF, TadA subfamily [Candidatus Hydrogenisulfobacillus filiaventi]
MSLKSRLNRNQQAQAFRTVTQSSRSGEREEVDYLAQRFLALKERVQNALSDQAEQLENLPRAELAARIGAVLDQTDVLPAEREPLTRILIDEITGYGPVQPLLDDPAVSEIMINGPKQVYIERNGRLELTQVRFRDAAHLKATLEKMLAYSGRRVDEASPMVDARLPDGSRLNAVIQPVSVLGDTITIRKFSARPFTMNDLIRLGTLSDGMAQFLEMAVRGKLNILVSGGTGSGKTTMLNALSGYIPEDERIITIEDAAELQLQQAHRVSLEARPPNIEGKGEITIRTLVRNALRMRPDRILVGEVRGGEALDMLQAMNTGHEGSLTTIHANSPRDALSRLETMVLMAGAELPLAAIRQQIASAIDLIVQEARLQDGSRKVVQITEVVGMEGGIITTQDLFALEQTGVDSAGHIQGSFRALGLRPVHYERLRRQGIEVPLALFGV